MNEPKPKSNSATMIIIVVLVAGVLLVLPCVIAVGLLGGAGFLFMRAADKEMRAMDANMPTMAVPTAVDEAMRIEPPTLDSPPVEPTVEQPTEPPTAEQP